MDISANQTDGGDAGGANENTSGEPRLAGSEKPTATMPVNGISALSGRAALEDNSIGKTLVYPPEDAKQRFPDRPGSDTSGGLNTLSGESVGAKKVHIKVFDDTDTTAEIGKVEDENNGPNDNRRAEGQNGRPRDLEQGWLRVVSPFYLGHSTRRTSSGTSVRVNDGAKTATMLERSEREGEGVGQDVASPSPTGAAPSNKEAVNRVSCFRQSRRATPGIVKSQVDRQRVLAEAEAGVLPAVAFGEGYGWDKGDQVPAIRQQQQRKGQVFVRKQRKGDDNVYREVRQCRQRANKIQQEQKYEQEKQQQQEKEEGEAGEEFPLPKGDNGGTLTGLRIALVKRGFSKQRLRVFRERAAELGMDVREWPAFKVCIGARGSGGRTQG